MAALTRAALSRTSFTISRGLKRINALGTGALRISEGPATTLATCRTFSAMADEAFVARDFCEIDNETLVELSIEGSVGESLLFFVFFFENYPPCSSRFSFDVLVQNPFQRRARRG
jgi:hypothetical protein